MLPNTCTLTAKKTTCFLGEVASGGLPRLSYWEGTGRESNLKIVTQDVDGRDPWPRLWTEVAGRCLRCVLVCAFAFLCSSLQLGGVFCVNPAFFTDEIMREQMWNPLSAQLVPCYFHSLECTHVFQTSFIVELTRYPRASMRWEVNSGGSAPHCKHLRAFQEHVRSLWP